MLSLSPSILSIPAVPNRPLLSLNEQEIFGKLLLRKNSVLNFVENSAFESTIGMYDENYQNSQAFSPQFQYHMRCVLELLKKNISCGATVVEVGCGKGDFFSLLEENQLFKVIGFDATYEGDNPNIFKRYLLGSDRIKADLIVLRHVLEHIPKPHDFLRLLKIIFGTVKIYIEVPNYDWILKNQAFFDITYEHVNYFSQDALSKMFSNKLISSGLLFDDQYQYIIAQISDFSDDFSNEYEDGAWAFIDFYKLFPSLVDQINTIDSMLSEKRRGYIWGASTKGCMFLAHCAAMNRLLNKIDFAIDINPHKVGKFLPGSRISIKDKADFYCEASDKDLLIVSNPNYLSEIVSQIKLSHLKNIEVISL